MERKEALARAAGLRAPSTPALEDVNRRRAQLWLLSLLLGITLPVALVTLQRLPSDVTGLLGTPAVRVCLAALAVALCGYVIEREHSLRGLTRLLVEERTHTADLVRHLDELDLLLRAGRAMNASLDLTTVLDIILTSACELLRASGGAIALTGDDPATGRLAVVAVHGDAEHRTPLVVPLVSRDQCVGELRLATGWGEQDVDEFQQRSVSLFAETAAAAIANARVHGAASASVATLTELERLKDEFLTLVTHELRTPLTSVIGLAQTIKRGGERLGTAKVAELADLIVNQGWRLDRLVDDLVRTRRVHHELAPLTVRSADAGEVVRNAVAAVPAPPTHAVVLDVPDHPVPRQLDADAVRRIVANLVDNAVRYTPAGTTVRVHLDDRDADRLVVVVSDDGPGIPAGERERVFGKFRRGEEHSSGGGLGLGLYLVRALAEAHGGSATLDGAPSGGCRATVALPASSHVTAVAAVT